MAHVGERKRDAHEGNLRMVDPHRYVEHVDVERVAVALRSADVAAPASTISGRVA